MAVGKGSRLLLVRTVPAAGFNSHSVACFYGSAPASPLSISVVFVVLPLLVLEHKLWVLHAGQAGHPCTCVWGKYSKPRRDSSNSDTQLRALRLLRDCSFQMWLSWSLTIKQAAGGLVQMLKHSEPSEEGSRGTRV